MVWYRTNAKSKWGYLIVIGISPKSKTLSTTTAKSWGLLIHLNKYKASFLCILSPLALPYSSFALSLSISGSVVAILIFCLIMALSHAQHCLESLFWAIGNRNAMTKSNKIKSTNHCCATNHTRNADKSRLAQTLNCTWFFECVK